MILFKAKTNKIGCKVKSQTIVEYALFLGIIVAVFAGMQLYAKRGLQAYLKHAGDVIGDQMQNDMTMEKNETAWFLSRNASIQGANRLRGASKETIEKSQFVSTSVETAQTEFGGTAVSHVAENDQLGTLLAMDKPPETGMYNKCVDPDDPNFTTILTCPDPDNQPERLTCFYIYFNQTYCPSIANYDITDPYKYYLVEKVSPVMSMDELLARYPDEMYWDEASTGNKKVRREGALVCVIADEYNCNAVGSSYHYMEDYVKSVLTQSMEQRIVPSIDGFGGDVDFAELDTCPAPSTWEKWTDLGLSTLTECPVM